MTHTKRFDLPKYSALELKLYILVLTTSLENYYQNNG